MWAQGGMSKGFRIHSVVGGLPSGPVDLSLLPTGTGTGWAGGRGGGARRGRGGGRRGASLSREEVLASQRWSPAPPGAGHHVRVQTSGRRGGGRDRLMGRAWLRGGRSSLPLLPINPCVHSAPSSRGGPRVIRGHDGPEAWRVRNLNHLWGRLRDFYQVRSQEGEAEPVSTPPPPPTPCRRKAPLISFNPSAPRRSCSC